MKKIWAICSGGDWADAGVEHVVLPDGMDLVHEQKERGQAMSAYWKNREENKFPGTFVEWLVSRGATIPSEDALEEYWED